MLSLSEQSAPSEASPRVRWPAWLLSCGLHFVAALLLAAFSPPGVRVTYVEPDRAASVAVVQQRQESRQYFNQQGKVETSASGQARFGSSPAAALPSDEAGAALASLESLLPSIEPGVVSGLEGSGHLPGIDRTAPSFERARLAGEKTRTEIFGVEGEGSTFVYVFDRSGSMKDFEGRPLAAAKRELIRSLDDLDTVHQFQIVFYNEGIRLCTPYGEGRPRLLFGVQRDKQAAADFVSRVVADGGTEHFGALIAALRMSPDVIFFLTDADDPQLSPAQLDRIRQMSDKVGAVINTIEFGVGLDHLKDNFIRRLAKQNGGRHVYVDVTALR